MQPAIRATALLACFYRKEWAVFYLGSRIRQLAAPSFFFLKQYTDHSAESCLA